MQAARVVRIVCHGDGLLGRVGLFAAEEVLRAAGLTCERKESRVVGAVTLTPGVSVELPFKNSRLGVSWSPEGARVDAPFGAVVVGLFGAPVSCEDGRACWTVRPGVYGPVLAPPISLSVEVSE